MSHVETLAKHSSHYFLGQLAGILAGFVSLPILTRVLTKDDFGQLSLVVLSVNFLTPFVRLGIPQSITRHYATYAQAGAASERGYVSTLVLTSCGIAAAIVPLFTGLGVITERLDDSVLSRAVWLIGPLLGAEVLLSVLAELFRAQLRSALSATVGVAARYAALGGSMLFFFVVARSLPSFLAGRALAQYVVVVLLMVPLLRSGLVGWCRLDVGVIREAIRYGLPLSLAASGGFFVAYGDRYVIRALLDSSAVAIYSVPYDLLQQIETALTTPIRMAVVPLVFAMLANDGPEEAATFLSQVLRGVLALMMPIIFGIAFLGRDVIVLLASQKYADASPLLPVLATGILLGSVNFLLSIGLMFQRRTTVIAYLTIGAGLFNILLNVLLIPAHGVMGSAWATLITYLIYPFVSYRLSSRFMRLEFYPASLARSAMAAAGMVGVLWLARHRVGTGALALVVLIPIGTLAYAAMMLLIEPQARRYARKLVAGYTLAGAAQ